MVAKVIDAPLLAKMFVSAAAYLDTKKDWINELNVFPVPDGDTGTNMTMTIMAAAKEVTNIRELSMASVCKAMSNGSLRGARGNSGVILSQLIRGFTKEVAGLTEIDLKGATAAFKRAVETAYKAVMKPKEGTILTVARGMAEMAEKLCEQETELAIDEFFLQVLKEGDRVLDTTPDLLPVLKQAGVVDSGGQGLMQVLWGAYECLMGRETALAVDAPRTSSPVTIRAHVNNDVETANIRFGYCTEFIVMLAEPVEDERVLAFKNYLESIGDSIVCVADESYIKIHVHTNDPGLAIQKALEYGPLDRMKIDNMRLEHEEKVERDAETVRREQEEKQRIPVKKVSELKKFGFIAVSAGAGLDANFTALGVDVVISGGQTMNPSTEDFIRAVEEVYADHIFLLPNNKNIVLAAEQAAKILKGKDVVVIPTKTIPQGIAAMMAFNETFTPEENKAAMTEAVAIVKTGEVTYSVRDTNIDGFEIKKGDYMGIGDGHILAVEQDMFTCALSMVEHMVDEESSLITVYSGQDTDSEAVDRLKEALEERFDSCDIILSEGGQPVYAYIISVE